MAKYLKYKDFNGYNNRISQTNLKKAMKGKSTFNKEYFIDMATEEQNKDSELTEYFREHYSMYLI